MDKIVGPGNAYVQAAKRMVYGTVDIDMTAGPSEVAIIADETLRSGMDRSRSSRAGRTRRNGRSMAGLLVRKPGRRGVRRSAGAAQHLSNATRSLARRSRSAESFSSLTNQDAAIDLVNLIAAEHVEVLMAEPDHVADGIRNAGALFIGRYAPTVVGDYFAGPSHVLPTGRTARFFSPLGVPDFMKRTSVIRYSGRAVERFGQMIEDFADAEGLTGHARSIAIRRHQA